MTSPVDNVKNIMIVCFESGGAQIVSSLVKSKPDKNYFFCLEGPAIKIFEDKIGNIKLAPLDLIWKIDGKMDLVLTGTSWTPDLERRAIALSKKNNVKSASVLEHWTNYRERFLPCGLWKKIPDDWKSYLPDEIWTCDGYAKEIALKEGFPKLNIFRMNNLYLDEIALMFKDEATGNLNSLKELKILYISEPVADDVKIAYGDPNYWGYTEFDIAKSIADFAASNANAFTKIRFRLHPNEPAGKYDKYISGISKIEKSTSSNLINDLFWADAVVGVESMALVIGLATGKPVFSCLPATAKKKCCLPHKKILHITSLTEIIEYLNKEKTGKEVSK